MRLKYNQFSENVNLIVTTKIFLLNILDACGECFFPSDTENNHMYSQQCLNEQN